MWHILITPAQDVETGGSKVWNYPVQDCLGLKQQQQNVTHWLNNTRSENNITIFTSLPEGILCDSGVFVYNKTVGTLTAVRVALLPRWRGHVITVVCCPTIAVACGKVLKWPISTSGLHDFRQGLVEKCMTNNSSGRFISQWFVRGLYLYQLYWVSQTSMQLLE